MFCDRCGTPVAASVEQCPRCGTPFAVVAVTPAAIPRGAVAWMAEGWNAVTANFWIFALLGFLYLLACSVAPVLVQGPMALGLQWACLRQIAGRRADINDLGYGFQLFPPAVLVCLATSLIIGTASLLLLLPGLAAAALLQFPYLLVIDRNLDFIEALRESFAVSQRHIGKLLLLLTLQIGIALAGALLCGVGLFIAIPVIYASTAAAYLDLYGLRAATKVRITGMGA
ncbi:MAG TPA: hypothetical protein VFQ91_07870 [Bryobacteraceae bacterium]|nr:hypothetical protein [Bryobacteraceae bacterium]